ncbi:sugar ABC transporter substrate-binding protein [Nocardioides acrostichi]|uniref:Substrate-binding domain-containing protein n=1 Tax=Nocardioides acrostichi TaxID=2784339 RepID=A0A930V3G6_9ACTN|nr:substrate-binding domain-containing protein [Nocardioides acrostichi]MBF4163304.1 substrate-binding domain-containing protein [Nocardioides acrostichi]
MSSTALLRRPRRASRHHARGALALLAAGALALALAACGSGSDQGGSTASNASTEECSTAAQKQTDEHLDVRDQDWYPTQSAPGSLAQGKKFWVIPLTSAIPTLADYASGFVDAGKAVGADVTVFDGKATPSTIQQGINSAVAAKADGIVLILIDPTSVAPALANAKAAGIPVLAANSGENPPYTEGISAAASEDEVELGAWQMSAALAATDCKLNAMLITSKGNAAADGTYSGFTSTLDKLCPDTCESYTVDIQPADVATKTQTLVQNALRLHPDTNFILMVADPFQPYVQKALDSLGQDVPISTSSSMGNLANLSEGSSIVQNVLYAPGKVHGWFYMTGLLDLLDGQKEVQVQYPIGLVNDSNWASDDYSSYDGESPYADYESEFKKLWKVQ